jgi:hypothetical protein
MVQTRGSLITFLFTYFIVVLLNKFIALVMFLEVFFYSVFLSFDVLVVCTVLRNN